MSKNGFRLFLCLFLAASVAPAQEKITEVTIRDETFTILTAAEAHALGFTDYPDIADKDNGAYDYLKALAAMKEPGREDYHPACEEEWRQFLYSKDPFAPLPAGADFSEVFEANAEMFRHLEAAALKPVCAYPLDARAKTFMAGMLLPHLGGLRGMARIIAVRSRYNLGMGNTDKALHDIELALKLSDSLKYDPTLIAGLVRVSILYIAEGPIRAVIESPDTEEKSLQKLLRILKDLYQDETARYMASEKVFGLTTLRQMFGVFREEAYQMMGVPVPQGVDDPDLKMSLSAGMRILLPDRLVREDMTRYYDKMIRISRLPYPEYLEQIGGKGEDMLLQHMREQRDWNFFSMMLLPALSRIKERFVETETRFTVLKAAARIRISGKKPGPEPVLKDLIGVDITDPFVGRGLLLKPEAGKLMIYSVGKNQTDDAGGEDDIAITVPVSE